MTNAVSIAQGGSNNTTFRNRIINGAMVIDQRNAGAAVTPTTSNNVYPVDRFLTYASQASKYTAQQNAGSVTPPTGFGNYLGFTSSSAYSVLAGDYFLTAQKIEGFNFADMAWGTASAATVTLSFWVRSSLTGTFGGALRNSANNRSYSFSYTISSANTWEQKTITIAGDTSGTWVGATNGIGVEILWSLGSGSTYSTTAGAWSGTVYFSVTGATSVVGTNGATFYITGVQLEKGSTASPFEYRLYGDELVLCQRYLSVWSGAGTQALGISQAYTATNSIGTLSYPVTPRTTPTGISTTGSFYVLNSGAGGLSVTSIFLNSASLACFQPNFAVASGLVAGNASVIVANGACAIYATGCEL
jgi:hypothetical protein